MALTLSEPVVAYAATTRRVARADVEQLRHWLCQRLAKRYPERNQDAIYIWLVQAVDSNEYHFVRNDRAIALAGIQYRVMKPARVVEEFAFELGYDGSEEVQPDRTVSASLYPEILRWAKGMGAKQVLLLEFSDSTLAATEKTVGELNRGGFYWAQVG